MCDEFRILYLLVQKNFIVRKRHWIGSIVELVLPACIIALVLTATTINGGDFVQVNETTYFSLQTKADVVERIPTSTLHLYFKPKNNFTDKMMKSVARCAKLPHDQLFGFDTENDMLREYEIQRIKDEVISVFAIDFGNMDSGSMPKKLKYMIRSSNLVTDNLFDDDTRPCSRKADHLIDWSPLVALQMCLDNAFINRAHHGVEKPAVVIQTMPCPPYDWLPVDAILVQNAMTVLGGVIFFATIYLIPTYISAEKTTGVNTLLQMNGVKPYQNLASWLVSGMLFSIIPVFAVTILLKINLYGVPPFYYNSNCSIIWLALFINVTHIYTFCLHVASYFSRAWLAQLVATTVPVLINIIAGQLQNTDEFIIVPYLEILCPTVASMRIFDELNRRKNGLTGAQWGNVFEAAHPKLSITGSLGFIMLFSILGVICHFILAVYLDAVLPSKYGVQKPPLFFLKYCKRTKVSNHGAASMETSEGQPKILEPVADGALTPGIQLRNLAKTYTSGCFKSRTVHAVRGISLDFYKGQITALLGHNGAGKTTTFSILTGLTAPSTGTVYINGKDIREDLDVIRSDLGVCPQENMMFPDLTVLEQLRLVGLLKQKDKTRKQIIQDVDDMLNKLDINEKRNVMPSKLSGGQKRRLCMGMALIGNASTIFLDEPTSGMDPETSRGTWDIILKYRKQKTIIITTHSMEEADILGDRIAIMHTGRMKCYGTSMFLKKFYGHNYHEVTLSTTSGRDEEKIQDMVGSEAKMNVRHQGRIVISIPFTSSLPEILDNMDSQKAALGITGVSVSTITLEQVFLKAAEDEESNEPINEIDGTQEEPAAKGCKYLTGSELVWQKISALLTKKITYFKTDRNLFIAMLFGALLAVLLPVLTNKNYSGETNSLSLDLSLYQRSEALIYSKDQKLGDTYKKIIESQGGIATRTKTGVSLSNELLSRAVTDTAYYRTRIIISAEFNSSLSANGLYSGGATFSAPITVNAMSNLVLKTVAGDDYSIHASIGDLPRSLEQATEHKILIRARVMLSIILVMTIFFHVIGLFVKHPLLENSTKVKQLQQMSGVSSFIYWGTMFAIDYAFYILITVLIILGIFVMDFSSESNSMGVKEIGILLLLFLLFGVNVLLLAYIHSFMKKQFHIVYSILSGIPLLSAFILIPLHEVLPYLTENENANVIQRRVFSLEPHISFIFGYVKFAEIAFINSRCRRLPNSFNEAACSVSDACCDLKCFDGYCANPLPYFGDFSEEGGFEEFFMYLLLTPIILVGILCLLEEQVFAKLLSKVRMNRPKSKDQDKVIDSEVEKEKSIVRQAINERVSIPECDDENVFLAYELSKCYGKLEAVKEVNFRVKKNECFGLLGVNGAGKSTTFRMLVGEEVPTSGILHRGHYSMKDNRSEYLAGMGYCPQNDALIPYFNAFEHLSLFASLRGVPAAEVATEARSWIDKLRLKKHAKNPSGSYSGGNKRRLNIAMALIANPKMVLLDEPTTGVDPAARRSVWTVLQSCQASGQAIILTSHSMEECEALCNRLVIMVRGRLLCVGASQELKERFGAGFNITIKLNPGRSEQDFIEIKNKIQAAFVCELKDEHPGYLFYHITDPKATWVKMFGTMNDLKSQHDCVEDFTVSTSTLEQLFMQFARSSADPAIESEAPGQSTAEANGA